MSSHFANMFTPTAEPTDIKYHRDSTAEGTVAETDKGEFPTSIMFKTSADNFQMARASLDSFEFIPNQTLGRFAPRPTGMKNKASAGLGKLRGTLESVEKSRSTIGSTRSNLQRWQGAGTRAESYSYRNSAQIHQ